MNYLLEGGGNFHSELLEAICKDTSNQSSKLCLITAFPLEKNHITLSCGHNFNYKSILEEITKQKKSTSLLETQKLDKYQIKCPYCRNIQNGILPFNKSFSKIKGVNWPPKYSYSKKRCTVRIKSGKRKGELCNAQCFNDKCHLHSKSKINILKKKCRGVFKSGKKSGLPCTYKACIGDYCKIHKKT